MNATATYKTVRGKKYKLVLGGATKRIYCCAELEELFRKLLRDRETNYHYQYIYNRIKTIRDGSYLFHSSQNVANPHYHRLRIAGSECSFFNENGESFIVGLVLSSQGYNSALNKGVVPGLYSAERDPASKAWKAEKPKSTIDTTYAALNGEAADVDEVMRYMPTMLLDAHKDRSKLDGEGFSLFYAPTKKGTDGGWKDMAQYTVAANGKAASRFAQEETLNRLVAAMELSSGKEVKWVVQGSGSLIFTEAMEALARKKSSAKALDFSKQKVVFYNAHNPSKIQAAVDRLAFGGSEKGSNKPEIHNNLYSAAQIAGSMSSSRKVADTADAIYKNGVSLYRNVAMVAGGAYMGTQYLMDNMNNPRFTLSGAFEWAVSHPSVTVAGAAGAAYGAYVFFNNRGPEMTALANLHAAAFSGSRRHLDQLTTKDKVTAFDQFGLLRNKKPLPY